MKKTIITLGILCVTLIVLAQSGVFESLVLFLLVGAVPGTNYSIPASTMLLILISILWLVIFRVAAIELFYAIASKRPAKQVTHHKKRMPKRRYSQI